MSAQQASTYHNVTPLTDIWNPGRGAYSAKIEPMQIGVNTMCENYADLTAFGPEVSFFGALQASKPMQRLLYKQGQANSSLVVDWKPVTQYAGGDGSRWSQLTEWLPLAVAQAKLKNYILDLKAVFWIGGENDAKPPATQRAPLYLKALEALFNAFTDLWNKIAAQNGFPVNNNYKKIIGRLYAPGIAFPFREIVRQAQTDYCANPKNNAVLIDTDSYPLFDYAHYDATGMIQYGLDIFNSAQCETAGFAPVTGVSCSGRVFLQGAYNAANGQMNNTLNSSGILQAKATTQPFANGNYNYPGTESVPANFFASNPDIVDWVLVELRDSSTPSSIVAQRAAFVKKDGTLVETDGSGTQIGFPSTSPGSYFVAIHHRNHLGIRSSVPVDLTAGSGTYDFTSDSSQAYQSQSYTSTVKVGNVWAMRGGNANSNGNVKYNGWQNDQDRILNTALGGSISKVISNVYASEDVNMDGNIKGNGPANDQDFLLNTILNGSTAAVYTEQI